MTSALGPTAPVSGPLCHSKFLGVECGASHLFQAETGLFLAFVSAALKSDIYSLCPRWEEGRTWAKEYGRAQSAGAVGRAVSITEGTSEVVGSDALLSCDRPLGKAADLRVQLNRHGYREPL